MAHVKALGSKARQGVHVTGKRLGLKVSDGEEVKSGAIIIRQRGTKIYAGTNVKMGRDHTLYAVAPGVVSFRDRVYVGGTKKIVDVIADARSRN